MDTPLVLLGHQLGAIAQAEIQDRRVGFEETSKHAKNLLLEIAGSTKHAADNKQPTSTTWRS